MAREAKIALGLDIKPLKKATEEAKKSLEALGNVKLDGNIKKAFKKEIFQDASRQAGVYKSMIQAATQELNGMANSGEKAWDHQRAQKLVGAIREYRQQLREVDRIQRNMRGPSAGGAMSGLGGFGKAAGAVGGVGRMAMGGLGMLGAAVGVAALIPRAMRQAEQSLELQALTGGRNLGGRSRFGFTREERRARGITAARGLGRETSERELERITSLGEALERGLGIGQGQFGAAVGAARRAGIQDETKFIGDAVGEAVAVGLTGSAIGEYLGAMTGYLSEISKGVDIDESSLRGFAAALGQTEFFKRSPERIFDAMRNLDRTFSQGNRFQQMMSFEAFSRAGGPGQTLGGYQLRQSLGLFGGNRRDAQAFENMGMTGIAETLRTSGADIINNMLKDAFKQTEGMQDTDAAVLFQELTGLGGGTGLDIFRQLSQQRRSGRVTGIEGGDLDKVRDALKTPEDMAKENMKSFAGSVKSFQESMDNISNIATDFAAGALSIANAGMDMSRTSEAIDALVGGVSDLVSEMRDTTKVNENIGATTRSNLEHGKRNREYWAKQANIPVEQMRGAKLRRREALVGGGMSPERAGVLGDVASEVWEGIRSGDIDPEKMRSRIIGKFRDRQTSEDVLFGTSEEARIIENVLMNMLEEYPTSGTITPSFQHGGIVRMQGGGRAYKKKLGAIAGHFRGKKKKGEKGFFEEFFATGSMEERAARMKKRAGKQFGGPIDSIPAMLTPGEFVINAGDASRNFNALVHANNGGLIQPVGDTPPPRRPTDGDEDFGISQPVPMAFNDTENTSATNQNTQALMMLAQAIRSMSSGGFSSFPRGSSMRVGV